jgi:hypothetical protein
MIWENESPRAAWQCGQVGISNGMALSLTTARDLLTGYTKATGNSLARLFTTVCMAHHQPGVFASSARSEAARGGFRLQLK